MSTLECNTYSEVNASLMFETFRVKYPC